ncbi:hypothetical protein LTR02_013822 [Friedmanniomyces endolithicus]|nr:hypothetical protein LTR59_017705 [Friedmanniomyces endolithicus]KAK0791027.1 hypothetical protein LTR38_010386 [Friedmanniomyces endolithicus]KAK0891756.1 hypothetical protein LTR02_013822 [Friedmanniomyces endolithicus]KAK0896914.1 hypothetical protein LTR57_022361 [Friedmanniomyces endolithicus]KAK0976688.1 hypothetical protein LTS01_013379 [Friedmanniomyces endolithicus]
MSSTEKPAPVKPRIIIHGGAGNITRQNLPRQAYQTYRDALLQILHQAQQSLVQPGAIALDVATHAVTLLEDNPLFNSGHGAVYTRAETHELEASVMVSKGYRKRGVGVMKVTRAKNPILLAKEMLVRGEADDGGGAGSHCQLEGHTCDRLAEEWGLEIVEPSYFWTRRRWEEHRRGLGMSYDSGTYAKHRLAADSEEQMSSSGDLIDWRDEACVGNDPSWDGCVVLDSSGAICVATSTGGITNKLPGRIGDTPTLGAGFWAEKWQVQVDAAAIPSTRLTVPPLAALVIDCLPVLSSYVNIPGRDTGVNERNHRQSVHAVAMSGTGNGDSFLRLNAVRTAAAMTRFSQSNPHDPHTIGIAPLQGAVTAMAGPHGALQLSAEDRWLKSGEGEGGIIGIDLYDGRGTIVADFNCGGMFRTWIDDRGKARMAVFREEIY